MKKKFLYWSPRILAILAILLMMIFSIDCFEGGVAKDILICFVMHNIPALILLGVLIIAWKWELIGGILFVIAFFTAGIFFKSFTSNTASLIVIAPFLLIGILFIVNYSMIEKKLKADAL